MSKELMRETSHTFISKEGKIIGKFRKYDESISLDELRKVLGDEQVRKLVIRMLNTDLRNRLASGGKKKETADLSKVPELD